MAANVTQRPSGTPRSQLAGRLIFGGLIPIAVFCGVFVFTRAFLGTGTPQLFAWTVLVSIVASVASVFLLARFAASAVVGEVEAMSEAVRQVAAGAGQPALPELTPPLEQLKDQVLSLAKDFGEQQSRLQEKLDTARQQIFFLTNHDPLTALANRKTLEERLETVLALAKKQGTTSALLYADLDHFHRINDSFGHLAGDELLRRLAPVLKGCLREGELLARIGGDEFAVVLEGASPAYASEVATRLRDAVQHWQFEWSGQAFQVGVSVGVVMVTRLTPSMAAALSEADSACLTAKERGRNRVFAFHDAEPTQQMRQSSRGWLRRIHDSLAEGAFTLLYQPILPVQGGKLEGRVVAEALLRMSDTGGELVMPMSFIPVAERFDLMRLIDRWVVERAFGDYRRLAKERGEERPAEFSINLSGHTLSNPEFEAFLHDRLAHFQVPADCLHLEIMDASAIANIERARAFIEHLRGKGVRFFLDDFGSGLASFNYLKHFPVDGIKIDGAFVKGVARSELDYALVEAIHKIATGRGLQSIAEYVESAEIAAKLSAIGIRHGQGFHLCPPRPLEAVFGGA
jgi:diguanylate cyclase (GGDEF)-like protein